jgi:hypothetical protein
MGGWDDQLTALCRRTSGLIVALAIVSRPELDFGPASVPRAHALAVTLKPHTAAAFDVYVAESDRQAKPSLSNPATFLRVDLAGRSGDYDALRKGHVVIQRLETRLDGKAIDVPDGMIHHWAGVVSFRGRRSTRLLCSSRITIGTRNTLRLRSQVRSCSNGMAIASGCSCASA